MEQSQSCETAQAQSSQAATDAAPAPSSELQTGAEIIVRSLIKQGVKVVFGYPGGQILDVYDELYKHADHIQHVLTAHEQGATHAADGYARATGEVGVVIATSGPGATNLVTGIATAHLDSVPLVAITGNVATSLLGKDSFQETDIFGITIPVTKHSYIAKDVNELPEILAEAFAIARSGRPGPVLIDVPRNVQTAQTARPIPEPYALQEQQERKGQNTGATDKNIQVAAELIAASKRPYIYCGGGVLRSQTGAQVIEFAERIDAVVGSSIMGLSAIPASEPRNLGMVGMHGLQPSILAKDKSDLVIGIGVRFSDRATGNKAHYMADTKFIHIDIDPAEIDKNIPVDVALVGEIADVVQRLSAELPKTTRSEWQQEVEMMRAEAATRAEAARRAGTSGTLDARSIIQAVRTRSNDTTVVATDVGQHQMWVAQNYPFETPRTLLTSGGLGTMGFGMGAAIGGCMGQSVLTGTPPQKTVLFTGDGSFGMNLDEMATAVSLNLPLVIVVVNNKVLGMVRQWQTLFYDERYSNTTLQRATDFIALARAFGADGCRVDSLAALEEGLDKAFAATGPFVVECLIDEDDKVFPMIPPGGTVNDMLLA
jgi:acetolactate synthase-1/2/3 large subunit